MLVLTLEVPPYTTSELAVHLVSSTPTLKTYNTSGMAPTILFVPDLWIGFSPFAHVASFLHLVHSRPL